MVDAGVARAGSAVGTNGAKDLTLPLARKIASSVGIAEIVLLEREDGAWMPLAVGDMSLDAIARADAWLLVPGCVRRVCCGHAGRCLYVAGVNEVPK